jgi:hypothetical protein
MAAAAHGAAFISDLGMMGSKIRSTIHLSGIVRAAGSFAKTVPLIMRTLGWNPKVRMEGGVSSVNLPHNFHYLNR